MSTPSDTAYLSFLDKANADLTAGQSAPATSTKPRPFQTKTIDDSQAQRVPAVLRDVRAEYESETDEPFEAVVLGWEGAGEGRWPGVDEFESLILPDTNLAIDADTATDANPNASNIQISTLPPSSFDPRGQYGDVIRAVQAAVSDSNSGEAEVKVYRVQLGQTRVEYFVVGLDGGDGGRVVGVRARAVES
ncbi:hypothetical protein FQN53_004884 [Emmonsiellopsis sp. PD_33]|nr:hypothetical protein FQN53_004884 [Emmonsiellopsis sp. PD_33]